MIREDDEDEKYKNCVKKKSNDGKIKLNAPDLINSSFKVFRAGVLHFITFANEVVFFTAFTCQFVCKQSFD